MAEVSPIEAHTSQAAAHVGLVRRALPFAYQGALLAGLLVAFPPLGATYETETLLQLEAPAAAGSNPLAAIEAILAQKAAELRRADGAQGLHVSVERSITVDARGARELAITCRDSEAKLALHLCNTLVQHALHEFKSQPIFAQAAPAVRTLGSRSLALGLGALAGLAFIGLRLLLPVASRRARGWLASARQASPDGSAVADGESSARNRHLSPPLDWLSSTGSKSFGDRSPHDSLILPYDASGRPAQQADDAAASTRDELRALCDQLDLLAKRGCFVIRVSSDAASAAAKSEIAAQLACSLAELGQPRVLLLEADFDAPAVHRVMGLQTPPFKGFSRQLYARARSGERTPWSVARCAPNLSVLAEGTLRTPGLLPSMQFSQALAELRRAYDIIVADGPIAGSSADARALDGVADGVMFAVSAGEHASDGLKLAAEFFGDKPLLWIIHTHPSAARTPLPSAPKESQLGRDSQTTAPNR